MLRANNVIWIRRLVVVTSVMVATGCGSPQLAKRLQVDGVASSTLYRQHAKRQPATQHERQRRRLQHMLVEPLRYERYTRTAINENRQLFHKLPNPTIAVYVYPHLATEDQAPVPGYTTATTLYERDHYATADEISGYALSSVSADRGQGVEH